MEANIVKVQSAVMSNFKGYVVLSQFDRDKLDSEYKIYLGKQENYDNLGNYDNSDNSLVFISNNRDIFSFLSSEGWVVTQQEMIDNGMFAAEDYAEYANLKEGVLKQFEDLRIREVKFGIDIEKHVRQEESGVPFRYPNWNEKQRLFVDMDGTLTVFTPQASTAPLYEHGYFLNLEPHDNVIETVKYIIKNHPEIDVYILSAYLDDSPYALTEKQAWMDKYLPEVDQEHRIFVPNGSDKKQFVGGLRPDDYLMDDYTKNLLRWQPGKGIKLLNAINHTHGTWQGDRIRYDREPKDMANAILSVMQGQEHIYDKRVERESTMDKAEKEFIENIARWEYLRGDNTQQDLFLAYSRMDKAAGFEALEAYQAEKERLSAQSAGYRLVVLTSEQLGDRYAPHNIVYNRPMTEEEVRLYMQNTNTYLEGVWRDMGNAGMQPSNYYGHSLSEGDAIVILTPDAEIYNHYVSRFGYVQEADINAVMTPEQQRAARAGMTVREEYDLIESLNEYAKDSGNEKLWDAVEAETMGRRDFLHEKFLTAFNLAEIRGVIQREQDALRVLYEREDEWAPFTFNEQIAVHEGGIYSVTNDAVRAAMPDARLVNGEYVYDDIGIVAGERLQVIINRHLQMAADTISLSSPFFYADSKFSPKTMGYDHTVRLIERNYDEAGDKTLMPKETVYIGEEKMAQNIVNHLNAVSEYGKLLIENFELRRQLGLPVLTGDEAQKDAVIADNDRMKYEIQGRSEVVIRAMDAAGYHLENRDDPDDLTFRTDTGERIGFAGFRVAEEWLDGVVFDDPDISDAVEKIMHPERFEGAEPANEQEPLVDISDLAYDDEGYLHFTVNADGYALEGLYRLHDPANGKDMEIVGIDYGDRHPIIERQWERIENALYDMSLDRYNALIEKSRENAEGGNDMAENERDVLAGLSERDMRQIIFEYETLTDVPEVGRMTSWYSEENVAVQKPFCGENRIPVSQAMIAEKCREILQVETRENLQMAYEAVVSAARERLGLEIGGFAGRLQERAAADMNRQDSPWGSWFATIANPARPEDYIQLDITGYSTRNSVIESATLVLGGNVQENVALPEMSFDEWGNEEGFNTGYAAMVAELAQRFDPSITSGYLLYAPAGWSEHSLDEHRRLLTENGYSDMPNYESYNARMREEAVKDSFYVVRDLQKQGPMSIQEFEDLDSALAAYAELPSDRTKALGIQNSSRLPGSVIVMQSLDGVDTVTNDYKTAAGWDAPEVAAVVNRIAEAVEAAQTIQFNVIESGTGIVTSFMDIERAVEAYFAIPEGSDRTLEATVAGETVRIISKSWGVEEFGEAPQGEEWEAIFEYAEKAYDEKIEQEMAQYEAGLENTHGEEAKREQMMEQQHENQPDPSVTVEEMAGYGYHYDQMLPLGATVARNLWENANAPVYRLYQDGTEALIENIEEFEAHEENGGLFGIEKEDWAKVQEKPSLEAEIPRNDRLGNLIRDAFEVLENEEIPDPVPASFAKTENSMEAAYRLDGETYLFVQTSEGGYDYTFYGRDLREQDGGQLDNPDLTLEEALSEILALHEVQVENMERIPDVIWAQISARIQERWEEDQSFVQLATRLDHFAWNCNPAEAQETFNYEIPDLAARLKAGDVEDVLTWVNRGVVHLQETFDLEDVADMIRDGKDLAYTLEHLDQYQQFYGTERVANAPFPIKEFTNDAGRTLEGNQIPGRNIAPGSFGHSDRASVFNAVQDFEEANNIPENQREIHNGSVEDKDFLYSGYDRYVGMSHRNDLALQPYMGRLINMAEQNTRGARSAMEPRNSYLLPLTAEVYYAQQNGLTPEQIGYILDNVQNVQYPLEAVRNLRHGLENGLSPEQLSVAMGEDSFAQEYLMAYMMEGGSIENATALKGCDTAQYYIISPHLTDGTITRDAAQAIIQAVQRIKEWNREDYKNQRAATPENVKARFNTFDTEFFTEYLTDAAVADESITPEMITAIGREFVEQRDTDSLKAFVENHGGIQTFRGREINNTERGENMGQEKETVSTAVEPALEGVSMPEEKKSAKDLLNEQLQQGIRNVLDSENFKNFLDTRSRMSVNRFSLRNAILVWMQKPDASHTLGYEQWKEFGRVPRKDTGIAIYAPVLAYEKTSGALWRMIRKNLQDQIKADPSLRQAVYKIGMSKVEVTMNQNGLFGLRVNGKEQSIRSEKAMQSYIKNNVLGSVPMYYTVGYVFDVKDTYVPEFLWMKKGFTKGEMVRDERGNPIKNKRGEYKIINTPERQAKYQPNLDMSVPQIDETKAVTLYEALKAVSERNNIHVYEKARQDDDVLRDGADGYYSREFTAENPKGYIVMPTDLDPTRKVSVMLHEMSHSELHGDLTALAQKMGEDNIPSHMREIQAEAVAYMVGKNFGIESDTSSFQYLAAFTKGFELQTLTKSIEVIYNECTKLTGELKTELAVRGLNMDLSERDASPMDKEAVQELSKAYASYIIEQDNNISDIEKDLPGLAEQTSEKENIVPVVVQQAENVERQKEDVALMKEQLAKLETADTLADQQACITKMDAAKARIEDYKKDFGDLTAQFQELMREEKGLKDRFVANPVMTMEDMKKDYPQMAQLTPAQIQYLAKSEYVSTELAPLLRNDPQEFVDRVCERAAQIDKVASKNGLFVEVTSCEKYTDKPVVDNGALMHPKVADTIVKQAETQVRGLRAQAAEVGDWFPFVRCEMMIYQAEQGQINKVYSTRIDIGDGSQVSLADHLNQLSSAKSLTPEFEKATREKGAKEKIISPADRPRAVGKSGQDAPVPDRGMARERWTQEINAAREAQKGDDEKEHGGQKDRSSKSNRDERQ